jgi:hypothetical protein
MPITGESTRRKLADAAKLLLVARDAVEHNFADGWFDLLKDLAANGTPDITPK